MGIYLLKVNNRNTRTRRDEADEHTLLHTRHGSQSFQKIPIKTNHIDVVVVAVGAFRKLLNVTKLWIELGTAKTMRYVRIHEIAATIRVTDTQAFRFFHALSGCGTT